MPRHTALVNESCRVMAHLNGSCHVTLAPWCACVCVCVCVCVCSQEMSLVTTQLEAARIKEAEEESKNAAGGGGGTGGGALKEKLAALQNQWKARQGIKSLTAKEERVEFEMRQQTLERNVSTCSAAIGQLQRELLEVEGNNDRERNVALNCPHVRSIQDAKKAVRFLFSAAVKSEIRASDVAGDSCQGEERAAELQAQVEALQRQLRETQSKYQTEVLKHEQAAQEKTLHLLSAMTSGAIDDNACDSSTTASSGAPGAAAGGTNAGRAGAGAGAEAEAFKSSMMQRLKIQQAEIDRLAAVAEERNELMRMQEVARVALEEKDKELEEVRRTSGGLKKAAPKKKAEPKVQALSETESSEEDLEEDDSASDDEWMPSAPRNREGAHSFAVAAPKILVPVAAASAPKGRGAGGAKGKAVPKQDNGEEDEWDAVEEMLPSLPDLQAMKVPDLKILCGRHGLKKMGKKDELVSRLHEKALASGASAEGGGGGGGGGGRGRGGGVIC